MGKVLRIYNDREREKKGGLKAKRRCEEDIKKAKEVRVEMIRNKKGVCSFSLIPFLSHTFSSIYVIPFLSLHMPSWFALKTGFSLRRHYREEARKSEEEGE